MTGWDVRRFVAYETLSVAVILALPGDWVYVGWVFGLLMLLGVALLYLRRHPQTPPSYRAPFWLTVVAFVAAATPVLLLLRLAGVGDPSRWFIVALGFGMLANQAALRRWAYRTAAPTSPT